MDPNSTYKILRDHVNALIELLGEMDDHDQLQDVADTVAEAFDALDDWMKKGGYLPNAWTKHR